MFYRGNLPHWLPESAAVFVTFRLRGTLPAGARPPSSSDGQAFVEFDRQLDHAATGPKYMFDPAVASAVVETVCEAATGRRICELHAFVVMPNHVHLLIAPEVPLARVMNWIKGVSARQANLLLDRTGEPFWQDESFDHWVRHWRQFEKIRDYIHRNPVRAGLVGEAAEWPYSSAAGCGVTDTA
jgi:putative transposase